MADPLNDPLKGIVIDPNDPWGAALFQATMEQGTDFGTEADNLARMRERAKQLRAGGGNRMDWASQARRALEGTYAGYTDRKEREAAQALGQTKFKVGRRAMDISAENQRRRPTTMSGGGGAFGDRLEDQTGEYGAF